ncbi:unnamed protein product [Cuscuta epithymum]|uniref:Uncharacterized protein n=1 Tax=Cuscuta epithymum TaxID=186058 RepID=A0AAV0FZJ3_9ASTE|nr:unnamed protein product [Cuscuta epithymum]
MGCNTSKVDSQEAVQLCKNRKMFIEQAVEYRSRFASGHIAYIESMRRVSSALRDYVDVEGYNEFLVDAFTTATFAPVNKLNSGFISISSKSFNLKALQSGKSSALKVNYCKSSGSPSVTVEEKPQSPETLRLKAYSPVHQYGMDSFFAMQSVPISSSFCHSSPNNRPNFSLCSPQSTQWDSFWDPFSSLDYYGYPVTSSLDQTILGGDIGLSNVRKEESIPGVVEHTGCLENSKEKTEVLKSCDKEVVVEDVNDHDSECDKIDSSHIAQDLQPNENNNTPVSSTQNHGQPSFQQTTLADCEAKKHVPEFTVYLKTGPTTMEEAIKDLDAQFRIACNAAEAVSVMLEATKPCDSSISNDLISTNMLKPVALVTPGPAKSFSSKNFMNPLIIDGDNNGSGGDFSDDSRFCCSHQSTLDRLQLWEKKLYEEVRAAERTRLAYEKKCAQLKNQEENNAGLPLINKTRAAIGVLFAQIKVSMHTVETISERIETLRDEELQPQLLQLMQGLGKMWKVMADSHQLQKCTIDAAKIKLHGSITPSQESLVKNYTKGPPPSEPHKLDRLVANLETELRNWRACFETWIVSQRSYLHALTGWLLCCLNANPITQKQQFYSPGCSVGALTILNICVQWSKLLDSVNEVPVLIGLDFFISGIVSLYPQHLGRRDLNSRVVEAGQPCEEEALAAEKMVDAANDVVCSGMSVSVGALTDFATIVAQGYADLLTNWEVNYESDEGITTKGV